jgi:uncharacterized protein (TIGR02466 family)
MAGLREDWFPTAVWRFDHAEAAAVNARILPLIQTERARDQQGMTGRSSMLGWHSQDNLHRWPEFEPLIRFFETSVAEVVDFLKWDRTRLSPAFSGCWANINGKLAANFVHNHPLSFLSGVYYVQAPEDCGNLFFVDPRPASVVTAVPVAQLSPWTFQKVVYQPKAGRLLIFPSWLGHGVEPNLSDLERVSVSFNVGGNWHS